MGLEIQKKFIKLSTKEWMQFFQYKLSSEREKELREEAEYDQFLKETIESIDNLESRNIAYQSLSFIHEKINENTGISSSTSSKIALNPKLSSNANNKKKIIGLIIAFILIVVGVIVYFIIKNNEINDLQDDTNVPDVEIQEVITNEPLDTNTSPIEPLPGTGQTYIPNTTPPVTSTNTITSPSQNTTTQSTTTPSTTPVSPSVTQTEVKPNIPANVVVNDQLKEKKLFNEAQELYKNDKKEEAKAILKKLKSYDNQYKDKATNILENIE